MSKNLKASVVAVAAFVLVVLVVVVVWRSTGDDPAPSADGSGGASTTVAENSHRLSDAGPDAPVFVEFLDFECEACGAAYPAIEDLREEYGDRVTFVVRYFPLPSHFNAERAAIAVEAAAQQGEFEAMYSRMFETQAEWGEQQVPLDDLFRSYAEEIGLDLDAYDDAIADPATKARVLEDREAGADLGVNSTPSFFLDGERIQPESFDDLQGLLDASLAD